MTGVRINHVIATPNPVPDLVESMMRSIAAKTKQHSATVCSATKVRSTFT